jgi:uncharacterized membrane protein
MSWLKEKISAAFWYIAIAVVVIFGGALFVRERKPTRTVKDMLEDQRKADELQAKIDADVQAAQDAFPPKPIPDTQAGVDAELCERGMIKC